MRKVLLSLVLGAVLAGGPLAGLASANPLCPVLERIPYYNNVKDCE